MAKNQTGNASNDAKNLNNQAQGLAGPGSPIMTGFQSSLNTGQSNQADLLNSAESGYKAQQTTGGYDPTQLQTLRTQIGSNISTGGYDPGTFSNLQSGYNNFATTGGYTPGQEQQFIRQATQGTTGTYDILAKQAEQNRAKTGGLGTGGETAQMARQLSQEQAKNTLNAETSLQDIESKNKLAGLSGGSQLAASQASNRLGATGQGIGLESGVAQGTNAANQGLSQLFNTQTNQVTDLGNQILKTLGLDFATQGEAINALVNLSKNSGTGQTIFKDIVAGLGGSASGLN